MVLPDFIPTTAKQWRSIATHSTVFVAGGVAFASSVGVVSPDDAQKLVAGFHQFIDGIQTAYGGASTIIGVLATIYAVRANGRGAQKATLAAQIDAGVAAPVVVKRDATGPLADLADDQAVHNVVKAKVE